ncbi:MAG: L,D-transpeptidase family protein [Bacillus subtilis]|nr:L,D-transpeptidase family protein [Bacillus subtilis]
MDWRNAKTRYHRSLHVSYPSDRDRERAASMGVPPGGDIMIHGLPERLGIIGRWHRLSDWTRGCIALTNPEVEEVARAVPDGTPIEIYP